MSVWTARPLTIFPEMFPGPLGFSIIGRAHEQGLWRLDAVDLREHAADRHRSVDDIPFGGGAGMVMRADVVGRAVDAALAPDPTLPLISMTPRGRPLSQARIEELAAGPGLIVLCGRFEGIDERVIEARGFEEVSIGDFVLAGGELAAMMLIEAVVRLLPGVVGDADSLREESFKGGLLEYPHYTRPQIWEGRPVPEVLLSGHHARIARWRQEMARAATRQRRPDLQPTRGG